MPRVLSSVTDARPALPLMTSKLCVSFSTFTGNQLRNNVRTSRGVVQFTLVLRHLLAQVSDTHGLRCCYVTHTPTADPLTDPSTVKLSSTRLGG